MKTADLDYVIPTVHVEHLCFVTIQVLCVIDIINEYETEHLHAQDKNINKLNVNIWMFMCSIYTKFLMKFQLYWITCTWYIYFYHVIPVYMYFHVRYIFFYVSFFPQFRPLEQLMGVFPAASKKHLPVTWQRLMCDPVSFSGGFRFLYCCL